MPGGGGGTCLLLRSAMSIPVESDREYARRFINDNCIARVRPGSKELPSYKNQGSGYYTWQFYLREALFNPRILDLIVKDFLTKFEKPIKDGTIQICGVESASTPLLTGIAIACRHRGYAANVFSIRKDQKPYGKQNWLEGKVEDNKIAMIVDDLISENHKTSMHAAAILFNQGVPFANYIYAMVYKTQKPENNKIKLLNRDVTISSMFSLKDFDMDLETYLKKKEAFPWS
jgi:orotate phosphoribosyltransferase